MAEPRHALTMRLKGQRSMSRAYQMRCGVDMQVDMTALVSVQHTETVVDILTLCDSQ